MVARALFLRILPEKKFPFGSKVREDKAEMIAERMYKLFVYTISSIGILFVLKKGGFLHVLLLGDQEDPQYYPNYPCTKMPSFLDDIYVLKLTYHLYELIYTLIYFRNRRDFPEYILHHIITMVLIVFSYSLNLLTLGSVLMLLTDTTDWFVCLFKLTVDITQRKVENTTYCLMLISWVYLRIWFFPCHIMEAWRAQTSTNSHPV